MADEYYIRKPDQETARGPYNIEKLQSLAEAGQVDTETLYYDENLETWAAIASNEELRHEIFP